MRLEKFQSCSRTTMLFELGKMNLLVSHTSHIFSALNLMIFVLPGNKHASAPCARCFDGLQTDDKSADVVCGVMGAVEDEDEGRLVGAKR